MRNTSTLDQLQAELSSLPADEDISTQRQRDTVWQQRQNLMSRINIVRNADREFTKCGPEHAKFGKWVPDLTRIRTVVAARLLGAKKNTPEMTSARFSLIKIDRGFDQWEATPVHLMLDDLLVEAGYAPGTWHGSLPYATRRLEELTARLDAARQSRDEALQTPAAATN